MNPQEKTLGCMEHTCRVAVGAWTPRQEHVQSHPEVFPSPHFRVCVFYLPSFPCCREKTVVKLAHPLCVKIKPSLFVIAMVSHTLHYSEVYGHISLANLLWGFFHQPHKPSLWHPACNANLDGPSSLDGRVQMHTKLCQHTARMAGLPVPYFCKELISTFK